MSNIEPIYAGNATFESHHGVATITIPPPPSRLLRILMILFLLPWLGGMFAVLSNSSQIQEDTFDLFAYAWVVGWAVGGFFLIRAIVWTFLGKEVITIENGILTIDRKNALLIKTKSYDLTSVKNIRATEVQYGNNNLFNVNIHEVTMLNNTGTVHFDYGMKTIRFGIGLDEIEGDYLITELKKSGYLIESNLGNN